MREKHRQARIESRKQTRELTDSMERQKKSRKDEEKKELAIMKKEMHAKSDLKKKETREMFKQFEMKEMATKR